MAPLRPRKRRVQVGPAGTVACPCACDGVVDGAEQPGCRGSRALPLAARRARQLAAVRSSRCDRGGHGLGQDRRGDRRRVRRVAQGPLRARRRALTRAHGAVARPAHGRAARRSDRAVGRQRQGPSRHRATCSSRLATRRRRTSRCRPAGPAGCSSPTSATAWVAGRCDARCSPSTTERLGLTATLERSDDGVTELLLAVLRRHLPPLRLRAGHRRRRVRAASGGVRRGRAVRRRTGRVHRDGAAARERSPSPPSGARACHSSRSATSSPRSRISPSAMPVPTAAPPASISTRSPSGARSWRRRVGKYELLGNLAPAIRDADGALVFTETVRAANHAINRLDPLVSIDLITGSTARRQRREILDDLRVRRLDAVAAPRVLDEGVDVPDANLGIVMSASRTRRQMIQRMGRILRRKRPGVAARFVIMFAKDTLEDPANRIERDGFLDEIERISEATADLRPRTTRGTRRLSRRSPARRSFPNPSISSAYRARRGAAGREPEVGRSTEWSTRWPTELGVEAAYAFLSFARRTSRGPATRRGDRPARRPASAAQTPTRRISSSSSPSCRRSPSRESSPSVVDRTERRSRSRASGPRGGSAAPVVAKHHHSSSSAGRSSTKRSPVSVNELAAHLLDDALPSGVECDKLSLERPEVVVDTECRVRHRHLVRP